jgi:hypothetical protein
MNIHTIVEVTNVIKAVAIPVTAATSDYEEIRFPDVELFRLIRGPI